MATYVNFHDCGIAVGKKTRTWIVQPKDGSAKNGEVRWHGAWRKYCFFTTGYVEIFEEICLREIAQFVQERTKEYRAAKAA